MSVDNRSATRQHFVDSVYFLQLKLFLRFSQISMLLPIYLYLRAGVLARRGWLFSIQICSDFLFLVLVCCSITEYILTIKQSFLDVFRFILTYFAIFGACNRLGVTDSDALYVWQHT